MELAQKYIKRSSHTASRRVDDEAVIVIPGEGLVRVANVVAAFVWERLDGTLRLSEIIEAVLEEFDTSREDAAVDVAAFIQKLQEKKMVEVSDEPAM